MVASGLLEGLEKITLMVMKTKGDFSMLEAVCLTASFGILLFFSIKEAKEKRQDKDG